MKYYKRTDCRLCGSSDLDLVLELTPTPPADSYIPKDKLTINQETIPLNLYFCNNCLHTQIGHVIDAEEVYLNYIYETASTLGLGGHFKEFVEAVMGQYKPNIGGLVLDIGSNDGIMLKYFKEQGMKILGIDPMPGIAEKATANGVPTLSEFFDENFAIDLKKKYGAVSVVSSNNLVADTDDLTGFVKGVKNLMDEDSIFFFETFYFYLQVENHVWDFTYHEHYSYFTVKPLVKYFENMGMHLIDIVPNLTKGGSMRCVVQLKGGKRTEFPSVKKYIEIEDRAGFNSKRIFDKYSNKIESGRKEYLTLIQKLKADGNKIVGYGASATSTTLMYHYQMNETLEYLVDDFEAKHNLYSPGFHIPVFSSDEIYDNPPDYIVVLAWRYYEKILKRHQKFIDQGGRFIIPLPELKII